MKNSPFVITLLLVIVLAVAWFGVWPFYKDVQNSRNNISSLEQSIQEEQEANKKLEELAVGIEDREEEVSALEEAVSLERDVAELVAIYEEAANTNGLILLNISIPEVRQEEGIGPTGPNVESVTSEIELSGTYPAFASFLTDIERSFPLLDIAQTSFTLSENTEQGGTGINPEYLFTAVLTSYYLR